MTRVFLDFESEVSKDLTLRKMTVAQYLARARILCLACAIDDEEPQVFDDPAGNPELLAYLRELAEDDAVTFVAHNWSFDGRALETLIGTYPRHAHCSMEAAMCAWPNQPGGYSLDNLGQTLHLASGVKAGHAIDVMKMTLEERTAYVAQDVRLCRDIYRLCQTRVPEIEWQIGELCNRIRECSHLVDAEAASRAVEQFVTHADKWAVEASRLMDDGDWSAFGSDEDEHVRSVKPRAVKKLLLENLGFYTHSISKKKADPVALAMNPTASAAVDACSKVNKSVSHSRRLGMFQSIDTVHMEFGWFRAHTGRPSAPSSGKGINTLNLPKHDKEVAPLFRRVFRLPPHLCYVRADEANVEYRVAGLLATALHIINLFGNDVRADPYVAFGQTCTGKVIDKKTKIGAAMRQLFKMAVLGLSYGMGLELWTKELLKALSKPDPDFTLDDLRATCATNHWEFPPGGHAKRILTKTGCDPIVVTAAYHTRRLFHEIHPELFQMSRWLLTVCEEASRGAGDEVIQGMYELPGAPAKELVEIHASDRFEGYSLEARCGIWPSRTVVWRDLAVRDVPMRGVCLSSMAGAKGYRAISPSICIENVVQSAARNATFAASLHLADRYPYLPNVYDEVMPIVPARVEDVLQARQDLIETMGYDGWLAKQGWAWAVVINPDEINVSRSLYEVPVGQLLPPIGTKADGKPIYPPDSEWWRLLPDHPELLERLP